MALTRILNNQVTDASAGNTYLGINAGTKVQDYTVSSAKLANNLVYASNLTVQGNLDVQGNTTTVDTVNLVVEDPLILLAKDQTGSPALDIGYIGQRGTEDNIAFAWIEGADEFATVFTDTTISNTTINIVSYANFHTFDANVAGNLNVVGTTTIANITVGNVSITGSADVDGNISGGNINSNGLATITGTASVGNLSTSGTVSATGNISGGNISTTGIVNADGNISGGNLNANGAVTTVTLTATSTATVGNLSTAGTVTADGNITGGNLISNADISGQTLTLSGNASVGNLSSANDVDATGNVTAGGVITPSITTASGDLVLNSAGGALQWDGAGNIVMNNQWINNLGDPVAAQDAATKQYVDDSVSTGIHIHTPVDVETPVALPAATYNEGGTLATVTDTLAGNTVVFSTAVDPQVNDQLWFTNSFNGVVANIAYFVVSAPNTSAAVLSTQYNGAPVSNITTGGSLTESVRINSGFGANLTANATGALTVDGYSVSAGNRVLVYTQSNAVENGIYVVTDAGNGSASWVLTRSDDANSYIPDSPIGLDEGSYVYVKFGDTGAGESYVMTAPQGAFNIGQAAVTFTQFSASQVYSANTSAGLVLNGTVFSAKVDNDTTAFDGGGNISVKAGANLVTPNIGAATGTSLVLTGNISAGNASITGTINADGNISGGNINSNGTVDGSTLSITGNASVGNLSTAGDVDATGNITAGNVSVSGLVDVDGNVTAGNLNANTAVTTITLTATGNATVGNVSTAGLIDADGNISGGNLNSNGSATVTGTATLGNLEVSGTGNIEGKVIIGNALVNSANTANSALAVGATTSILVAVGNTLQRPDVGVTGMLRFNTSTDSLEYYDNDSWTSAGTTFTVIVADSFVGNGVANVFTLSQDSTTAGTIVSINGIVQIPTTAYSVSGNVLTFTEAPEVSDAIDARILTTTTTVTTIQNASGNAAVEALEGTDTVQITGNLLPSANVTYNLGSDTVRWNDIYLANSTIYLGNAQISANASSLILTNPEGATTVLSGTTPSISVEEIVKIGSNGVGNIGSESSTFNTIFAKATSAQYADLAEMYEADADYEPGTVLCFGGAKEVTLCGQADSTRVAGVVSTNPSYLMNSGQTGECVVAVALTGRVPCRVTGTIRKGDLVVSTGDGRARANNAAAVGTVIGKALADFDGADGVIEVVVGRV